MSDAVRSWALSLHSSLSGMGGLKDWSKFYKMKMDNESDMYELQVHLEMFKTKKKNNPKLNAYQTYSLHVFLYPSWMYN